MNKKTKLSVLYCLVFIFFTSMGFGMLKSWLSTESVYIFAKESTPNEVLPTSTPKAEITPVTEEKPLRTQIKDYIVEVFKEDSEMALKVFICESNLRPDAVNDNYTEDGRVWSRDWGIAQINDYYHDNIGRDWKENIRIAKKIFDGSGWYAWSCFKSGAYERMSF